ncbi:hypothetical protein [Butyrivibrio sp. WCE2006]|uniref:hypothetical protein n=1 Tax=Butyrivibrio sp. WCE2006 TaxID=1410611 RepID=UPI0005D25A20|nr:hypothetical protein [Butyrivibrio sp. WCE2006]
MKNRTFILKLAAVPLLMLSLSGCGIGSSVEGSEASTESSETTDTVNDTSEEATTAETEESIVENEEPTEEDSVALEESNESMSDVTTEEETVESEMEDPYKEDENKPAIIGTYKPSEVYDFCKDQSITEALFNCTVNQNEEYAHNGGVNLGEAFPEKYKDIDLDGDGLTDHISRVIGHTGDGCIYSFSFGNGISFVSAPYTMYPNTGELISFRDFDKDNVDEILIVHITDSTGGPIASNCELYTWSGSGWEQQWAVDEDGAAGLAGVDELLSGEVDYYMVRDVELREDGIFYLIDYGQKDGANMTLDLEAIQIGFLGHDMYMEERSDKENRQTLADKIWPYGI